MHSPTDEAYLAIYEVKENMYDTTFISLSFFFFFLTKVMGLYKIFSTKAGIPKIYIPKLHNTYNWVGSETQKKKTYPRSYFIL